MQYLSFQIINYDINNFKILPTYNLDILKNKLLRKKNHQKNQFIDVIGIYKP
jgi:hypothetical protein